jgi:site-specific DNA recombinase
MASRKRALIKVRLSSYDGATDDTSTSPERQEEQSRAYCAARDWEVAHVIHDLDVSASDKGLRLDRPGLIRAREWYPRVDVLVVAKLDRLARNVADFLAIHEEARTYGVDLVSVNEGLDMTTPAGKFVAVILAAFAEMEAATIAQRTREAVAYLARVGRHRGGNAPYGWRIAPLGDGIPGYRLALHPTHAPILRAAVLRVIDGVSPEVIAAEYREKGYPGPGDDQRRRGQQIGPPWDPDVLRRLLRRPILRGMQVHRGELVRGEDGLPIRPHDALVSDAEWRALQDRLSKRAFSVDLSRAVPHVLLRGLVACTACGAVMHAVTQEGKNPVWSCSRKLLTPDGEKCPGASVSRARLEEYVVSEVLRVSGHLEGWQVTEEERADEEALEVSDALDAVLRALRDVEDPAEEDKLLARRRALRARLTELQAAPVIVEASRRPTGRTFAEDYAAAATDTERAALLRSQIAVVGIRKGVRGRRGLDPSRVRLLFSASATEPAGDVSPGVLYVEPAV